MSYCRWSSNNFNCDLYVYEDAEGFRIHVASKRYNRDAEGNIIKNSLSPIGLPCDGRDYLEVSAKFCLHRMKVLQKMGYNVPKSALDAMEEVAGEEEAGGQTDVGVLV